MLVLILCWTLLWIAGVAFFYGGLNQRNNIETGSSVPVGHVAASSDMVDEIAALAERSGWTYEKNPSPALWYRIIGKSGSGLTWNLIQGLPTDREERRNGGLRWSTDEISIPHLWMEVFPKHVYERMKNRHSGSDNMIDQHRFGDSLKMVHEIPAVPFLDPTLNERFILLTVIPTVVSLLFTPDIEQALRSFQTDALRISLGYPNLRIGINDKHLNNDTIQRLAKFGVRLTERYLSLSKAINPAIR